MKNICFLTNGMPYPPNTGGKSVSYNKIQVLKKHHNIYLAVISTDLKHADLEKIKSENSIKDILLLERPVISLFNLGFTKVINILFKFILTNVPLHQIKTLEFKESIMQFILDNSIEIIFSEGTLMNTFLDFDILDKHHIKLINTVFDLENKLFFEQHLPKSNFLTKIFLYFEKERIKRHERLLLKKATTSICLSCADYNVIVKNWHIKNVQVIPPLIAPSEHHYIPENPVKYILFSGSLSFYPNLHGINWFVQNILPTIVTDFPEIKLMLITNTKLQGHEAMSKYIVYKDPPVGEVQEYQANATLSIIPIFLGSGIKIKAIETLSTGTPTITTEFVASAFPSENGTPLIIANTKEEFINEIYSLLKSTTQRKTVSLANIKYFNKYLNIENNNFKWLNLIDD